MEIKDAILKMLKGETQVIATQQDEHSIVGSF